MKESGKKDDAKVEGPLSIYLKSSDRAKFEVEEMLNKENSKLEEDQKEISEERKTAKSKKRKLEIFRKCRRKLEELTLNWNETKDMEEERRAKMIKEAAMKEILKETLNMKKRKVEEDDPLVIKPLKITLEAVKLQTDANSFMADVTADLGCDNGPDNPFPARFGQQMPKLEFTKPQLQLQASDQSEAELPAMDRAVQPIGTEMMSGTGPYGQ